MSKTPFQRCCRCIEKLSIFTLGIKCIQRNNRNLYTYSSFTWFERKLRNDISITFVDTSMFLNSLIGYLIAFFLIQANIGNMDKRGELQSMIIGNIVLTQLQAIVVGFLAALVSLAMGWVPRGDFNIRHALVLCSSSISTASIASLALGMPYKLRNVSL